MTPKSSVSPTTLNEALTLIKAKEKFDAERIIKTFDDSEIQVLNGRFGYIFDINL
jgi:DNA topoisomerase-1